MQKFKTEEELLKFTKNIVGKTFKELNIKNKKINTKINKGILGQIVEEGFYGYPNNNLAEADFSNLGVELKVSGFKKNKNGTISAKERLVLSKIDYNSIINEEFEFSKLLFKNKKLLIIWYEYEKEKNIEDFVIKEFQLYNLEDDELIIKNDFEIIKGKVLDGKAHLLSEGDTSYLGACTKAANSLVRTNQPLSDIMAKPRAFSLKNSFINAILRGDFSTSNQIEYKTVVEYVYSQIQQYIGMTQMDILFSLTGKKTNAKQIGKMISDIIIGKDSELKEKNSLFSKTNYIIKNLPINKKGFPVERMAFRNLRLSDFEEEWKESEWKTYFEELTLIVLCYEAKNSRVRNGFRILKNLKKITFNSDEVENFGKTYDMIRSVIKEKDLSKLPIPKSFENQLLVIGPKGVKGDDAYNNFLNRDNTNVCFMLDKEFLFIKLKDEEIL